MSACQHKIHSTKLGHLLVKEQYVLRDRTAPIQLTGFSAHYNKDTSELHISGNISVLNKVYDKLVKFVYTIDSWNTQHEVIANYEWHDRTRATFHFSNTTPIHHDAPVVHVNAYAAFEECESNTIHYDSNFGANFSFVFPLHEKVANWHETPLAVVHTSTVSVHSANLTYGVVFGTVSAANWSADKKVMVLYTRDNWETTEEVEARYCCSADGRDNFAFEYALINEREAGVCTSYCVRYETCGSEFWDGNKGANFTFSSPVSVA